MSERMTDEARERAFESVETVLDNDGRRSTVVRLDDLRADAQEQSETIRALVEALEAARGEMEHVYTHYAEAEISQAQASSQLGHWRSGMAHIIGALRRAGALK